MTLFGVFGLLLAIWRTCGALVFPLDDGYIHLAVARTLAETGTWGLLPETGFASPSSSPAWTLLLAGSFLVARPAVWIPLAWASLFAALASAQLAGAAVRAGLPRAAAVGAALLFSALIPLPSMVALGMEHTLQIAVALALLRRASEASTAGPSPALLALCLIAPMVRYELLTLVLPLAALAAARGAGRSALAMIAASSAGVAAFAVFSLSQGGGPLPTSLTLKITPQGPGGRLEWLAENLKNPGLGAALLLGLAGLALARDTRLRQSAVALTVAAALQGVFGRTGWGWRYEAWLVAIMAPVGFALAVQLWRTRRLAALLASTLIVLLLAPRAARSILGSPDAARDVADLWLRPAQLLRQLPPAPVAVNALGAFAWEAGDRRILDLDGLGSADVAKLLRVRRFTAPALAELLDAHGIRLLFLSTDWRIAPGWSPPAPWTLVATTYTRTHYVPGFSRGALYTRDEETRGALETLLEGAPLPGEVIVAPTAGQHPAPSLLEGPAVQVEDSRVAFYSNGRARWVVERAGRLRITLSAELPDHHPIPAWVQLGQGPEQRRLVGEDATVLDLGPVEAGEAVSVEFKDDRQEEQGRDWNLFVWDLAIRP